MSLGTCLWRLYFVYTHSLHLLCLHSFLAAPQMVQTGVSSSSSRAYPNRCNVIWEVFGPPKEIRKEWVRFPGPCTQTTALKWNHLQQMINQVISWASLFPLWLAWADVHTVFSFSQTVVMSAKTPSHTGSHSRIWVLPCPFPLQTRY